jgi:hypothetical protein
MMGARLLIRRRFGPSLICGGNWAGPNNLAAHFPGSMTFVILSCAAACWPGTVTALTFKWRYPGCQTYLGHVKITDTYWYVTGIPELLNTVSARFERFFEGGEVTEQ